MSNSYIKPFSNWNLPKTPCTNSGSQEEIEYIAEYTEEGYQLQETGKKINIQAKINSYKADCDLGVILQTLLDNGLDLSNGVSFTDEITDISDMNNLSIHELTKIAANYESNLKYYQEKLKELKDAEAKLNDVSNNNNEGGNVNVE